MLFIGAFFLYRNYLPKTKEGEKSITVTVVHGDGSSKDFDLQTNSEYLREALEEQDLITGTEGEYGLFHYGSRRRNSRRHQAGVVVHHQGWGKRKYLRRPRLLSQIRINLN